jgi:hypothetical protein
VFGLKSTGSEKILGIFIGLSEKNNGHLVITPYTEKYRYSLLGPDGSSPRKVPKANDLLVLMRFADGRTSNFVVNDTTRELRLLENKNLSSKLCSKCWDPADVADYDNWPGNSVFNYDIARNLHPEVPFILNLKTLICEPQCKEGTASNLDQLNPKVDGYELLTCLYANCKQIMNGELTQCSRCWSESDMSDHGKWRSRLTYP